MASIRLARRPIGRETFAGIAWANCNVNARRIFCANIRIYVYKAEVSVKRKVFPTSRFPLFLRSTDQFSEDVDLARSKKKK